MVLQLMGNFICLPRQASLSLLTLPNFPCGSLHISHTFSHSIFILFGILIWWFFTSCSCWTLTFNCVLPSHFLPQAFFVSINGLKGSTTAVKVLCPGFNKPQNKQGRKSVNCLCHLHVTSLISCCPLLFVITKISLDIKLLFLWAGSAPPGPFDTQQLSQPLPKTWWVWAGSNGACL